MHAALNITASCKCGKTKDRSRQWCESCFNLLSKPDRDSFIRAVWTIRKKITALQVKMNVTLQVEDGLTMEDGPVDLRESEHWRIHA